MEITVYTNNDAIAYEVKNAQGPVPRIGEVIVLGSEYESIKGMRECLVIDVSYMLHNGTLTPFIDCKASVGAINRNIELDEKGWLKTFAHE